MNVHPHTLALDGVYVRAADGQLVFHPLAEPSAAEVAEVVLRTARRVGNVLKRHGHSLEGPFEGADDSEADTLSEQQLALASCYGAAARGLGRSGPRAGQPTLRLVEPELGRQRVAPLCALVPPPARERCCSGRGLAGSTCSRRQTARRSRRLPSMP